MSFGLRSARFKISIAGALLAALLIFSFSRLSAQDGSAKPDHSGHDGMSAPMDDPRIWTTPIWIISQMDAARQRKLLADKKESEFNHHLAGFFVVLAGIFILAQGALTRRWSFLRFALAGLFSALQFVSARLQRHGVMALWSAELVVRSHPQSRGFAAQDVLP